jgi:hypothetical protein
VVFVGVVVPSLTVGTFAPAGAAVVHAVAVVGLDVLARVLGPVVETIVSDRAASMESFVPQRNSVSPFGLRCRVYVASTLFGLAVDGGQHPEINGA